MQNQGRYFFLRQFFSDFPTTISRIIFELIAKKVNFETADIEELKTLSSSNNIVLFLSHKTSIIEQFLLNGYFITKGIKPPSHSFGPRTIALLSLSALKDLILKLIKSVPIRFSGKLNALYIPLDDKKFFTKNPVWASFIPKLEKRTCYAIPVTTLWNKDLHPQKKREKRWLFKLTGRYNIWSTFTEFFLFVIGRRKLTFRIGVASEIKLKKYSQHLYQKFYKILEEEKLNVVGVSLKNWLELRNETLLELDIDDINLKKQAQQYLLNIETRYSPSDTDRIAVPVHKILASIFSKLVYDDAEIKKLRRFASMRNINIVFIPTHKSYFDYLILFNLLYREKVTVPLVVSGDNLSFFPLGIILRKIGAFFIKRSINNNNLYRTVFKIYLKKIIESGYNIEFFIEGGRSRSGRVRTARTGIMDMLAEIKKETRKRIYIVPVSITYEKLKEVKEYETEERVGKIPEKDGFLRKILALFKFNYGPAYITFGTPLYMGNNIDESFSHQISTQLEQNSYISFSSIFATLFITEKTISGDILIKQMEHIISILSVHKANRIAPSLRNLDINVPRLIERLVQQGDLIESEKANFSYSVKNSSIYEFSYYKNSIAFTFAPYFMGVFTNDESLNKLASNFLKSIIKGYTGSKIVPPEIEEIGDTWFHSFLSRYFQPHFLLLHASLNSLKERTLTTKKPFSSKRSIVSYIKNRIVKKAFNVTQDDLFEIVIFMEKYNIIDNLLAINVKIVNNMLVKTIRIIDFMEELSAYDKTE